MLRALLPYIVDVPSGYRFNGFQELMGTAVSFTTCSAP